MPGEVGGGKREGRRSRPLAVGVLTDPEEVTVDRTEGLVSRLRVFELVSWKVGGAEHLVWLLFTVTFKGLCR